ncbi:MAG TPA: class I SAM-dependent methyltransferase [Gaiellaceae bacterium]|nr:class I SAM-dependent methyltransferase [Gaiellaceae bacterium]
MAWRPDEQVLAGEEHLDPAYVAGYDAKAGFDPAELALLGSGGTLVELGTGTGTLAAAAARGGRFRRVVGVDPSPAMLAAARARDVEVEWVQAGFLSYEHAGAPADAVYSRHALHHLPDLWKAVALARVAALLRPGGVLRLRDLVFSCGPDEVEAVVDAWLAAAPERPEHGWTRAELETHLRTEHSTFSWLLEPMLERAGFSIRDAEYGAGRTHAAYVCVRS